MVWCEDVLYLTVWCESLGVRFFTWWCGVNRWGWGSLPDGVVWIAGGEVLYLMVWCESLAVRYFTWWCGVNRWGWGTLPDGVVWIARGEVLYLMVWCESLGVGYFTWRCGVNRWPRGWCADMAKYRSSRGGNRTKMNLSWNPLLCDSWVGGLYCHNLLRPSRTGGTGGL
jgi:hypothetical protein